MYKLEEITNKIIQGDSIEVLKQISDESIDCCVTSPPYWGLRDYGMEGQIGLESTPEEYVGKMVEVFREVRRVLRDDGTLWINLGDSYAGSGKGRNADGTHSEGGKQRTNTGSIVGSINKTNAADGLKPKDLVGIPWRVALALQADGWYLRSDIIWSKPNAMPESVKDRPTKAHEYIFLMSKSLNYFYDSEAIKEPAKWEKWGKQSQKKELVGAACLIKERSLEEIKQIAKDKKNKRTVWSVPTTGFPGAHFATFPPKLIEPCILAGCSTNGIVLDPFMGSGTTAMVATYLQRNFIGIELNPEYIKIAEDKRLANVQMRMV